MANGLNTTNLNAATYTFDNVWHLVASLSKADKKRMTELLMSEEETTGTANFPKVSKEWKPSPIVYKMVEGRLPVDVDIEKEKQTMWEKFAQ